MCQSRAGTRGQAVWRVVEFNADALRESGLPVGEGLGRFKCATHRLMAAKRMALPLVMWRGECGVELGPLAKRTGAGQCVQKAQGTLERKRG